MTHPARTFRLPRGFRTRWWLAGILIGCLLPIGMADARLDGTAAQLIRICFHSPEHIRAESRRRYRLRRLVLRVWCLPVTLFDVVRAVLPVRPWLGMPTGHDVLSRRGPPSTCHCPF
ncbi:hypothetical protein ACUN8C_06615 [Kushneria sp. Sum13]|uniref:hypothetical protein n=1 Tax=Kushneria sp. Sum13 TaxID=3459196 RepID=UPI000D5509F0